jgi:hypothetical protein
MRTIKEFEEVKLVFSKAELLDGKYISYQGLATKLRQYEKENDLYGKGILTKFRNSYQCGKYNTVKLGGIVFFECGNLIKDKTKPIALKIEIEVKQ